ncbi:T9SS type A sorting domain-containing protein, partial [Winogradskyella sp.]|uniref:T9SS type A sorting domain-containing protein n=1 Tax=Winogradskyella sp. TaxID=1883156 RepID=UPI003F6C6C03
GVRVIVLNNRIGLYNLPQSTDYTLYDISGKQVLKGSIESESHVIETKNIANGIYIVELTDNTSNRVIRKKVVL